MPEDHGDHRNQFYCPSHNYEDYVYFNKKRTV